MIKFIPLPVTLGFTNGIAVLIFSTQIKDFFGLKLDPVPSAFLPKMEALGFALPTFNPATVGVAVGSLLLILLWPVKWRKAVPGSIVALIAGTLFVTFFRLPVETIGSRFHDIPQGLPPFQIPAVDWGDIQNLIRPATTIALLAAIESLLSAVVADGMIDDRHDSNQELIAQGVANLACPFFGGIPATGAIARTATNIRSGAVSPIAGIVHSATLLLILLVAAPLAKFIPLATLSAVLMLVAFNMGEWQEFALIPKYPKGDAAVFLTTFSLTVIFDLTIAVEIGMILAAFLFIQRVSETTKVSLVDEGNRHGGRPPLSAREGRASRRPRFQRLRRAHVRRRGKAREHPPAQPPGTERSHPPHAKSPRHGFDRAPHPRAPAPETAQARRFASSSAARIPSLIFSWSNRASWTSSARKTSPPTSTTPWPRRGSVCLPPAARH